MDAQMRDWDDLRYFLAVARHRSLAGAAREIGVNHSTVLRRIGALERTLQVRLFDRLPRGYALTAAAEEMLPAAQQVEEEIVALGRRVAGRDLALGGMVRLTTTDTLADLLAPHLADFRRRYPGIELDVLIDNRVLSLSRREADVALRPGERPREGEVVARRVCGLAWAVYASRAYVGAHGAPRRAAQLRRHLLVRGDDRLAHIPSERWMAAQAGDAAVAFRSNTPLALLGAVRAGLGVAALPCFLADADAELVRVLPPIAAAAGDLWLLIHVDLRRHARVRAFVDHLSAALATEAARLEGRAARRPTPHSTA